jgi:S-formylglutathione hydrolase FrmB
MSYELFPFHATYVPSRNQLFSAWVQANREWLDRDHGSVGFVGETTARKDAERGYGIYAGFGKIRSFSWYELDMTVTSKNTVTFQTYDRASSGGHGQHEHLFENQILDGALLEQLKAIIEKQKRDIVANVQRDRERTRERIRIQSEQERIYFELFCS